MFLFFFKQKTAYEMRISDWSSDVCSSDLVIVAHLSEEERRETEQNGKYLYFGRYLNGKAGFQHDGHRHRQHDPGHQEDVDPLLLDGQENELPCHHGL